MTLQPFSLLTVDSLIIQPGASGLSITNNALSHTATPESVNSGQTINAIYEFANPISFTGVLTLKYDNLQLNGNTETALEMIYSATNPSTTWVTTSGTVVNTTSKQITQNFNNTTIARVSATSNTTPLAIQLIQFDVKKDEKQTVSNISWRVAAIDEIEQFIVERSSDGKNFKDLEQIQPSIKLNYQIQDTKPFSGWNYYRLKMIGFNGEQTLSTIKSLQFGKTNGIVSVFPNPVFAQVTIHTTDPTLINSEAIILDINGRTIKQFKLNSESTTITAEQWAAGIYLIKLQNGQTFKIEKR